MAEKEKIRTVVVGCGHRGIDLAAVMCFIDAYEIIGVCDTYEDKAVQAAERVKKESSVYPKVYTDYIKMYDELKPDVAVVVANWEYHVKISVDAMKRNIAVAMEVGGAYNLEECFELVEVYEQTKTPFMFLENCCYGEDELLALSLVRNGVLGEICYCSGAYGHNLRQEISYGDVNRHYRLKNYKERNCENYPTHELGPIAKILNINRGNRMVSLTSMASKSRALHEYTMQKEDLKHLRDVEFQQGDIVVTTIKCENGELITLRLDTTLPRFYSRELVVRGTKGWYNEDNNMVFLDGDPEVEYQTYHGYAHFANYAASYKKKYMPDLWKGITWEQREKGHGGIDYFEFLKFADYYQNGKEIPIDVYDAAAWMCITCLSEQSIANGGAVMQIPDFTKGAYKNRPILDVVEIPKV